MADIVRQLALAIKARGDELGCSIAPGNEDEALARAALEFLRRFLADEAMIEHVAKAIYERPYAGVIGKYWHRKWVDASVGRQTMCRRDAIAAIDAALSEGTTPPMARAIEAAESVASPHLPKAPGER